MNVLIPHNWLSEYLKTNLKPSEIAGKFSLGGVSVAKVERVPAGLVNGQEYVYDIEVTSNRPDMLSVIGIAREGGAILEKKCLFPKLLKIPKTDNIIPLKISNKVPQLCPRYLGIVLTDIEVKPSPRGIQQRLKLAGQRPINNVVDITNYVMLEYGQPLHAFDLDFLEKNEKGETEIIIRRALKGEKITTLDNQHFKLDSPMVVIADPKEPVAIGGIKGGIKAEVGEKTKTIVLECANFNALSIRRTSRALNLRSDAYVRFDKGLTPLGLDFPFQRAIDLLQKFAGATIASQPIDAYSRKLKPKKVDFHFDTIERVLGVEIPPQEVSRILRALGFRIRGKGKKVSISVPYWRYSDIEREEDFVEEVARIYGYHRFKGRLLDTKMPEEIRTRDFYWEDRVKDVLISQGFTEVYNYSFVQRELLDNFSLDPEKHLQVENPLSQEFKYMRHELLPSLLKVVAENQKRFSEIKIFEMANVYRGKGIPYEQMRLSGLIFQKKGKAETFYALKGVLEILFKQLGITNLKFEIRARPFFDLQASGVIRVANKEVGVFGLIKTPLTANFQIKDKVFAFDLDFAEILRNVSSHKTYTPLPKYPAVELDLSVVVSEKTLWRDIAKTVNQVSDLVQRVELFDVYRSRQIGKAKKSVAFKISYRSDKRSLKEEEAKEVHNQVIATLKSKFEVQVREK